MTKYNATAQKLLDVAERKTQTQGFNAFSYKDLQNEVGVKTSSIHYYFPSKQDLALAMSERYISRFNEVLSEISAREENGINRLRELGDVYINEVRNGRFCMCGMLASDMLSLPDSVNASICEFFTLLENWIAESIDLGIKQGFISNSTSIDESAKQYLSSLEGAMLIARARNDAEYLTLVVNVCIQQLEK